MDLPITTDAATAAAALPEGLQAEDLRQAVVVLSAFIGADIPQVAGLLDGNEMDPDRLRRACDVLNFLGGQLASVEAFQRAAMGAQPQQEGDA